MKFKIFNSLCFISLIFLVISCSEVKKNYYKDLYNLTDNQKMWLPEILYNDDNIKKTINEVFENHDLDTNEIWGTFQSNFDFSQILENQVLEDFSLNKEKLKKRLNSLTYENDIQIGKFFYTNNFNCILYYDTEKKLYYYYGIYKMSK